VYKKWSIFIVIGVIIVGLLLSACSSTPTTTTATTTVNPITLKVGYPMPRLGVAIPFEKYFTGISEKTNGRLKFEFYPAGSLYQTQDALEAVKKGVTDVTLIAPEVISKSFPLTLLCALPQNKFPDTLEGQLAESKGLLALGNKFPAVANEWKDFKFLYYSSSPTHVIMSSKTDIIVPADLKGLKVGCIGNDMMLMTTLGAAAVVTPPPLSYQNMKTGVVDIIMTNYGAGYESKLQELTKYVNEYPSGGAGFIVGMNWDTWNKISPADQKLIMDTVDAGNRDFQTVFFANEQAMKDALAKAGAKINVPGPEWNNVGEPLWASWKADAKAAGVANPDEIFNAWKQMIADYVSKNIVP
jgi:TRAP-type C4-dicarboxylate transport system substrate-binding protein